MYLWYNVGRWRGKTLDELIQIFLGYTLVPSTGVTDIIRGKAGLLMNQLIVLILQQLTKRVGMDHHYLGGALIMWQEIPPLLCFVY